MGSNPTLSVGNWPPNTHVAGRARDGTGEPRANDGNFLVASFLHRRGRLALFVVAPGMVAWPAESQIPQDSTRVSIVYTGRSLGALGVRRSQDEHELLTEQASAEKVPFKLVSHMAWRAPGIVVFLPSAEPVGDELAYALAHRAEAERLNSVRALVSANALLLQDPWRPTPDLLAMIARNSRRAFDFPDLVETRVTVSRIRSALDNRIVIVEQPGAVWPDDPAAWTVGEMNRVDVLDSRVFELPLNLGELGPRATLLRTTRRAAQPRSGLVITADLGHQAGDVDMPAADRARLDFTALRELGYTVSVPFELELGLGAKALAKLHEEFPEISLFAANVRVADTSRGARAADSARSREAAREADSSLFISRRLVGTGAVRVGLVGLVNARVRERLPRAVLRDFRFESPITSARREVARLRADGATAVVVLSNMDPADNALLATEVPGIDAIIADMPVRWALEATRTRVELLERPYARPGAPALVARSAANGLGVGRLDLEFRGRPDGDGAYLTAVEHQLNAVTDRIAPDTAIVRMIAGMATVARKPRGELMFPAFVELEERHPELRTFDEVSAQGRVSKRLWEAFMARLLRVQGRAEVAVIRRLDQFPAMIGKLHENEIGAWLWTEDHIVLVDLLGADLKSLLREDARGELATSGIDLASGMVLGHRLQDQMYYRVATTDVLFEGARAAYFARGRRVRRFFGIGPEGELVPAASGASRALKDFVFGELQRIRTTWRGDGYLDQIAARLRPDPKFVNLLSFTFDRPTLSVSFNQVQSNGGYGSVPESRVTAKNSWVAGVGGRFVLTHDRPTAATDLGVTLSYARQTVSSGGRDVITESADDIKLDLTFRPTAGTDTTRRLLPFARGEFDSEFTPTADPKSGKDNPRQLAARAIGGFLLSPTASWRRAEIALVLENDFGRPNLQYGVQSRSEWARRIGGVTRADVGQATYRLRNDVTYFLPSPGDDASGLALRYNMVHELVVPLVGELALSVAADLFFFQGKVAATRALGSNAQLRMGLTYDRFWKPRYQPFF